MEEVFENARRSRQFHSFDAGSRQVLQSRFESCFHRTILPFSENGQAGFFLGIDDQVAVNLVLEGLWRFDPHLVEILHAHHPTSTSTHASPDSDRRTQNPLDIAGVAVIQAV